MKKEHNGHQYEILYCDPEDDWKDVYKRQDLIEVNWKRGIFNQLRDIKLSFMRAGYKLFGEIRMENRKWEGEIVAKNSVDTVRFHVV